MIFENNVEITEKAIYNKQCKNPVYIVLMHTGTPLASAIKKIAGDQFSHACISFNSELDPLYSFGSKGDNHKGTEVQVIPWLTKEEVEDQAAAGKVGFGRIYSDKKADEAKAVENALQCFEDGLVRVFQGDQELTELDGPVRLKEGDRFTLIRLTFLAGRLW